MGNSSDPIYTNPIKNFPSRAKFWAKFAFWIKFSGLLCWDIQSEQKISQNSSPEFPRPCTAKLAKTQEKTS